MLAAFSRSVILTEGRTVAVQPELQIVRPIVACVTVGFSAPGVQRGSGRENRPLPIAWHEPAAGWGWTTLLLAVEKTSDPPGAGVA